MLHEEESKSPGVGKTAVIKDEGEFKALLRHMKQDGALPQLRNELRAMDNNGNGEISYIEYHRAPDSKAKQLIMKLEISLLAQFDRSGKSVAQFIAENKSSPLMFEMNVLLKQERFAVLSPGFAAELLCFKRPKR